MSIRLQICQGTTCFVMGSSELLAVADHMPEAWRDKVEISGTPCLENCKKNAFGRAPFVRLDGELVESASVGGILLRLAEKLGDGEYTLPEELR